MALNFGWTESTKVEEAKKPVPPPAPQPELTVKDLMPVLERAADVREQVAKAIKQSLPPRPVQMMPGQIFPSGFDAQRQLVNSQLSVQSLNSAFNMITMNPWRLR